MSYYNGGVSSRSSNDEGGVKEKPHAGSHFGGQLPSVQVVDKDDPRDAGDIGNDGAGSENDGIWEICGDG